MGSQRCARSCRARLNLNASASLYAFTLQLLPSFHDSEVFSLQAPNLHNILWPTSKSLRPETPTLPPGCSDIIMAKAPRGIPASGTSPEMGKTAFHHCAPKSFASPHLQRIRPLAPHMKLFPGSFDFHGRNGTKDFPADRAIVRLP